MDKTIKFMNEDQNSACKCAFTLAESGQKRHVIACLTRDLPSWKCVKAQTAFTLAETLIALAVIGIVAAMTIPNIVHQYKKTEIETKLKKFYSVANQALQISEIENGFIENWNFKTSACQEDTYGEQCLTEFWDKYFKNYIKHNKTEYSIDTERNRGRLLIWLADGSVMQIGYMGHDIALLINEKATVKPESKVGGRDYFLFGFYPSSSYYPYYRDNRGIVPYVGEACRSTEDSRDKSCLYENKNYTRVIQLNNWKIPDDYPVKL